METQLNGRTEANERDTSDESECSLEKPTQGKDFEDVLEGLGSFGRWQRLIFALIGSAEIWGAFAMLLPILAGAEPNWWCMDHISNASQNASLEQSGDNITTAFVKNASSGYKQCYYNDSMCSAIVFRDEFSSIVSEWSLVCSNNFVSDLMTSIQMAGLLLGAAICSQISDLIGRKKSFFLAFFIMTAGGIASGAANSWQLYAACRFLVGFGFGGNMVILVVFPMEFMGRKWRVLCGTIGFWAFGSLMLALMGYLLRDWRHLTIGTAITGLGYLITMCVIPESPRWLLQHGRVEEAERILANIARRNGRPRPDISTLKHLAEMERQQAESAGDTKYTYLDLIKSWKYAKRTIIMFLAWFTVFMLYYEVSYNLKNLSGDRYFNMMLSSFVDWGAMISVIFILSIVGRRKGLWTYLTVGSISLLSILGIIVAGAADGYGGAILALALLGKAAGLSGTYSVQIYTAELFPTVVRNIGVGAGSIAARISGIVAPQLVFLGTISKEAPYIIIAALCIIVIPLLLLIPETKGQPLEDRLTTSSSSSTNASDEDKDELKKATVV